MAIGPGKFDIELSIAIESAKKRCNVIEGGILIIFGEEGSNGFSAQTSKRLAMRLPKDLRDIADQIEKDLLRILE